MEDKLLGWLRMRLEPSDLDPDLQAYVVGVLDSMRRGGCRDLSDESVVLAYSLAVRTGEFVRFQTLADWTLWVSSFAPQSVAEPELIEQLGMMSYAACDRMMRGRWPVFAVLALRLPDVISVVRSHVFAAR